MKDYGTINLGYAKMDFMEGVQIKTGKQIIYTVYGWDKNFQSWIYENLFEREDEKERTFSEVSKLFGAEGKFKFYPEWWCDGYEFERLECTKFERNGNGINFFFGSNMPFLEEIDENALYIALFELAVLYEEFKKTGKTESFEEYPKFSDRAGTANLKWCKMDFIAHPYSFKTYYAETALALKMYDLDLKFVEWIETNYKGKRIATSANTRKNPYEVGDEIVVEVNRINKSRYNNIDRNLEIQMLAECSAVNISLRGVLDIGYGKDLPVYRTGPEGESSENVNHALYEMALLYEKYKKEAGK